MNKPLVCRLCELAFILVMIGTMGLLSYQIDLPLWKVIVLFFGLMMCNLIGYIEGLWRFKS